MNVCNIWTDIYVRMHDTQIKYLPWKMILSLLNEPIWMRRDNITPEIQINCALYKSCSTFLEFRPNVCNMDGQKCNKMQQKCLSTRSYVRVIYKYNKTEYSIIQIWDCCYLFSFTSVHLVKKGSFSMEGNYLQI